MAVCDAGVWRDITWPDDWTSATAVRNQDMLLLTINLNVCILFFIGWEEIRSI